MLQVMLLSTILPLLAHPVPWLASLACLHLSVQLWQPYRSKRLIGRLDHFRVMIYPLFNDPLPLLHLGRKGFASTSCLLGSHILLIPKFLAVTPHPSHLVLC